MAALPELEQFDPEIFQIETDSAWLGGVGGLANNQGKALANRTKWLKAQIEGLGTGKQDADPTLAALAALVGAADKLAYFTGADTAALTTLTAFSRSLLAGADAAAARTTLGAISQAQLDAAIAALVASSPAALDTLNELAAALGNDANFAATVNNAIALRLAITEYQKAAAVTAMAGGTADAITAAFVPAITTDVAGRIPTITAMIVAQAANTGAGLTIDVGTGAFGVVKGAGAAIVAGDVHGAGHVIHVRGVRGANAAADKWVILNPAKGITAVATALIVRTADYTSSAAIPAKITWTTVKQDPLGLWDAPNNQFVIQKSGMYDVRSAIHITPAAAVAAYYHALINGSTITGNSKSFSGGTYNGLSVLNFSGRMRLNAGDTLAMYVFGSSLPVTSCNDENHCWFELTYTGEN